jgi:MFS family permease
MARGVGSTVGAFLLATQVRASLRLLLLSGLGLGSAMVVLAHAPNQLVAVGVLVCTGALMVLFQATNNTLLQIEARENIRGRVLSLFTFLTIGSTPVGGAFTGYVADATGVQTALQINASVCLFGLVLAVLFVRRMSRA